MRLGSKNDSRWLKCTNRYSFTMHRTMPCVLFVIICGRVGERVLLELPGAVEPQNRIFIRMPVSQIE
jgi:hypothetical protein